MISSSSKTAENSQQPHGANPGDPGAQVGASGKPGSRDSHRGKSGVALALLGVAAFTVALVCLSAGGGTVRRGLMQPGDPVETAPGTGPVRSEESSSSGPKVVPLKPAHEEPDDISYKPKVYLPGERVRIISGNSELHYRAGSVKRFLPKYNQWYVMLDKQGTEEKNIPIRVDAEDVYPLTLERTLTFRPVVGPDPLGFRCYSEEMGLVVGIVLKRGQALGVKLDWKVVKVNGKNVPTSDVLNALAAKGKPLDVIFKIPIKRIKRKSRRSGRKKLYQPDPADCRRLVAVECTVTVPVVGILSGVLLLAAFFLRRFICRPKPEVEIDLEAGQAPSKELTENPGN